MDGRESRFAFGFLLLGIAPLFASLSAGVGMVIFLAGLVIGTLCAFA
ncbi:MAG: hypothetical protein JW884_14035 [Deltaproteobacteria bacterium]|nr:hypothetical protein [Deltaproteobacteria bacterium]